MLELRRRKSRVASCRPDFKAFLAEYVVVSPTSDKGRGRKEEDKQTARAKEKFPAENFSRIKYRRYAYTMLQIHFFADQIRREMSLLALPEACRSRD